MTRSRLVLVPLFVLLVGCATGAGTKGPVSLVGELSAIDDQTTILLMNPDVKYYRLTAGGLPEPNAEWTDLARTNFRTALQSFAAQRHADVIALDDADRNDELIDRYDKLHSAVGSTILTNYYGGATLPAKAGRFDWSLGPGISELADRYHADYALFSFYRDYQASGGRIAFAVLAAAAGVFVPAKAEFGFASLVDLRTGEIVWFNRVTAGRGELRDASEARTVIDDLFRDMPRG